MRIGTSPPSGKEKTVFFEDGFNILRWVFALSIALSFFCKVLVSCAGATLALDVACLGKS